MLLPFNAGSEEVALQYVRQQAEDGADFIKVAVVTPQVFYPLQAEATRLGLSTVGHLPVGIDVKAASDGRDAIDRAPRSRCGHRRGVL